MGKVIGKTFEAQQVESQSDDVTKAQATQDKSMSGDTASDIAFGLPGRVQAEKNIENREDAMSILKKELEYNPSNLSTAQQIIKASVTGLKGLQLVDERVQGSISGALYELQDPFRKDVFQDTGMAIINGLSGKRKVRFEDMITSRLPELDIGGVDIRKPIAVIGGLAAELSVGGKLVDSVKGMLQGGKNTLKSIEKSYEVANDVRYVVGKSIEKLFDSPVGKVKVPPQVQSIVDKLPEGVLKKILSHKKVYGVSEKFIIQNGKKVMLGVPELDAKNVWKLRMALDDVLSSKDFIKSTNLIKSSIKNVSGELRGVLSKVDPQIAPLMEKYSKYSGSLESVSKIITSNGKVVVNKAANVLKRTGEPGAQTVLEEFASLFPRGQKMLKDIKVLNRNRAVTNAALLAAKATVGAAIFSRFVRRPVYESVSDSPRSGGSDS